ncbi:MAG TPA: RNase H family protein, partial [Blastocatellia bacterium]
DFGTAVLYYKPTADSFSMRIHELKDKSIAPLLEEHWHGEQRDGERRHSGYEIYVDGSFARGATGYGAVILKDGKVVEELSGGVDAAEVDGTYQIAGELAAVKHALTWCRKHSVNEVSIYYDYLGIEKWATRQWKANQPVTQAYAQFIRECPIKIHWHKVDSHTGDRWNDRADALAKKGARSMRPGDAEKDLASELIEKTEAWIEFLMLKGIDAAFDRVYNDQYARVVILEDDQALGTFDLYNTKKKGLSPYLHNFRDEELKAQIESLWQEFASRRQ